MITKFKIRIPSLDLAFRAAEQQQQQHDDDWSLEAIPSLNNDDGLSCRHSISKIIGLLIRRELEARAGVHQSWIQIHLNALLRHLSNLHFALPRKVIQIGGAYLFSQ